MTGGGKAFAPSWSSDKSWNMICLYSILHDWWGKGYWGFKVLAQELEYGLPVPSPPRLVGQRVLGLQGPWPRRGSGAQELQAYSRRFNPSQLNQLPMLSLAVSSCQKNGASRANSVTKNSRRECFSRQVVIRGLVYLVTEAEKVSSVTGWESSIAKKWPPGLQLRAKRVFSLHRKVSWGEVSLAFLAASTLTMPIL